MERNISQTTSQYAIAVKLAKNEKKTNENTRLGLLHSHLSSFSLKIKFSDEKDVFPILGQYKP